MRSTDAALSAGALVTVGPYIFRSGRTSPPPPPPSCPAPFEGRSKLPKTWRRATVVALPKPNKPAQDPKSYRPISLLCVPFNILERLIHSRIDTVVDPQLPREQAGFRRGRSTVDQVTLLTQYIEDSFQNNEKDGVVFLDLTAAYDTVWHRGIHLKLLRITPETHGGFHHGDVVKSELRSAYQRRAAQ